MGNSYFQFKSFKINQENAPLKVCTDACILGASVNHLAKRRILDIGTGTGLLALMLAQRYELPVDAIEINPGALEQAKANFDDSPWGDRIFPIEGKIQDYASQSEHIYDLIVCNPPFFANHLKATNEDKNQAVHNDHLSIGQLATAINQLLVDDGRAYVMYPEYQASMFKVMALHVGLNTVHQINVKDKANSPVFRVILELSKTEASFNEDDFIIKKDDDSYTDDFSSLLKPYYLNL